SLDEYAAKRDFSRTPEPSSPPRAAPDPHPPLHRAAAVAMGPRLPKEPPPAGLTEVAALEEGRRFTIQQHHARRLHHDVRFEQDGVLVWFAVPKRVPAG